MLFTGGPVQTQLGSGSGSGGAVGQGGPDITKPGKGGETNQEGSGTSDRSSESMKMQDHESSGKMGSEGAIIMKPKPGGEGTLGGSGRLPDSSTTNP